MINGIPYALCNLFKFNFKLNQLWLTTITHLEDSSKKIIIMFRIIYLQCKFANAVEHSQDCEACAFVKALHLYMNYINYYPNLYKLLYYYIKGELLAMGY